MLLFKAVASEVVILSVVFSSSICFTLYVCRYCLLTCVLPPPLGFALGLAGAMGKVLWCVNLREIETHSGL